MNKKSYLVFLGTVLFSTGLYAQTNSLDSVKSLLRSAETDSTTVNRLLEVAKSYNGVQADSLLYYASLAMEMSELLVWQKGIAISAERMAVAHIMKGDFAKAEEHCLNALDLYQKLKMDRAYAMGLITLGILQNSEFKANLAKKTYFKAMNMLSSQGSEKGLVKVYANLANVYQRADQNDSALYFHHKALFLNQRFGNDQNAAINETNIGVVHQAMGNNEDALKYFSRAYKTFTQQEALQFSRILQINVAKVHLALSHYSDASIHYEELKKYYETEEPSWNLASINLDLGSSYLGMEMPGEALACFTKAKNLFQEFKDTSSLLLCIINIGEIQLQSDKFKEGVKTYRELSGLKTQLTDQVDLANVRGALGRFYRVLASSNNFIYFSSLKEQMPGTVVDCNQAAIRCFTGAVWLYKKAQRTRELEKGYEALKELHQELGQLDSALLFSNEQFSLRDSLLEINNVRRLTQLELRFEFDKASFQDSVKNIRLQQEKDVQIHLEKERFGAQRTLTIVSALTSALILLIATVVFRLRKRTQKQNKLIAKRNTQIEWLLKEIHHRVKNNLQIVSSLMSIQSRKLADPVATDVLKESQNRIKSISLVHESLYQVNDLSQIDLVPFLSKIAEHVQASQSRPDQDIRLHLQADEVVLEAEQAIPFGIILNELISNSYKHVFKSISEGAMTVTAKKVGEKIELLYTDSGDVFLPEEPATSDGIGMALIESLAVDQLGGSFDSGVSDNVKFRITFPYDHNHGD